MQLGTFIIIGILRMFVVLLILPCSPPNLQPLNLSICLPPRVVVNQHQLRLGQLHQEYVSLKHQVVISRVILVVVLPPRMQRFQLSSLHWHHLCWSI